MCCEGVWQWEGYLQVQKEEVRAGEGCVPRPTLFFLFFGAAFFAALPHPCIIVNGKPKNRKNGVGLGTRLGEGEVWE